MMRPLSERRVGESARERPSSRRVREAPEAAREWRSKAVTGRGERAISHPALWYDWLEAYMG